MVKAVRGAVQVDDNTPESMKHWIFILLREIMERNAISENNIISILFSQTADLTTGNPASALRQNGFQSVPLFCTQEPVYPDSLPATVRVLVTFHGARKSQPVAVYLNGAEVLRKDLSEK